MIQGIDLKWWLLLIGLGGFTIALGGGVIDSHIFMTIGNIILGWAVGIFMARKSAQRALAMLAVPRTTERELIHRWAGPIRESVTGDQVALAAKCRCDPYDCGPYGHDDHCPAAGLSQGEYNMAKAVLRVRVIRPPTEKASMGDDVRWVA